MKNSKQMSGRKFWKNLLDFKIRISHNILIIVLGIIGIHIYFEDCGFLSVFQSTISKNMEIIIVEFEA